MLNYCFFVSSSSLRAFVAHFFEPLITRISPARHGFVLHTFVAPRLNYPRRSYFQSMSVHSQSDSNLVTKQRECLPNSLPFRDLSYGESRSPHLLGARLPGAHDLRRFLVPPLHTG